MAVATLMGPKHAANFRSWIVLLDFVNNYNFLSESGTKRACFGVALGCF